MARVFVRRNDDADVLRFGVLLAMAKEWTRNVATAVLKWFDVNECNSARAIGAATIRAMDLDE
jgi:hypothetical protein